jgi:DNA invertase Pin-like site-specific DNA recombinase
MKLKYSTKRIAGLRTTASASKSISCIQELQPGPVVLYLRESGRGQEENLKGQEDHVTWELERRGFEVVAVFKETVPGWAENRIGLERAALKAKEVGAVVVAESGCRFLRSFSFKRDRKGKVRIDQKALPNVLEMDRVIALVDGAQLATLLPVDTHWKTVRGAQSKRGQIAAGNRGGRPGREPGWKNRRRESKMLLVLRLRRGGLSYRKIGVISGVPWSTVRDWIQAKRSSEA